MSIKNIKNKFWLTLVAIIFTLTSCVHNKKDATISKKIKTEKPSFHAPEFFGGLEF